MNCAVYYFTGTGNSLVAARDIANALKAELFPIPVEVKKDKIQTDAQKIVIVFPVYAWGPPVIVREFVKKIEEVANKKIFVVTTFGGSAGATVDFIDKDLSEKGGTVFSNYGIKMADNCITLFNGSTAEKLQTVFDSYVDRIDLIIKGIADDQPVREKGGFISRVVLSNLVYKFFLAGLPNMDKKFYSDDKCTKCGICSKICPVGNIELVDGRPVWNGSCQQCMACIQWCPAEAIQHGKKTVKRRRYRHPDVSFNDMYKQTGR